MKTKLLHCLVVVHLATAFVGHAVAQTTDAFFNLPWAALKSSSPQQTGENSKRFSRDEMSSELRWHAVLDGDGEVYVNDPDLRPWTDQFSPKATVAIHVPKAREITGRVFVFKRGGTDVQEFKFQLAASEAKSELKTNFFTAKANHFQRLLDANLPGAAWFRHEMREATKQRGNTNAIESELRPRFNNRRRESELEDSYDLFSGGRAMSENLQLDRVLPATKVAEETVALTNLTGITVKEMDWKKLIAAAKPETDPLAAFIPADQHAVFFPSFQAMTEMLDEADANGTPVLQLLEPRSEDSGARERYQKQLCLGLSEVSRLLGPTVVASTAFTGSDPFLRVGTDIAILFETRNPELLKTFIGAQQKSAQTANAEAKAVKGSIAGVTYVGVASPDRSVCSYLATISNVVIVCNSLKQLENLTEVAQAKTPALVSQDEYTFFRQRYPRTDKSESAFVVLTDATIRRWCGPQWRIADSRRTRAAAVLAELQAANLPVLAAGQATNGVLTSPFSLPDAGEFRLAKPGVTSTTYGTLNFMTPIAEIPLPNVTRAEADGYTRWRDNYQNNSRQFFDPIAIRFSISREQLAAELTVMPLILGTDYRQMLEVSAGSHIAPTAGDPHTNSVLHVILGINPQSKPVQEAGNFVGNMVPGLKANPLAWLGQSISFYADEDPFWERLKQATNADDFLEHSYSQLPIALNLEVKNSLGLAVFLTALRAYVDQTAPQMTTWQNLDHHGQAYVKITQKNPEPGDELQDLAIYYAVTPRSLVLTLNEPLLQRALERQASRASTNEVNQALSGIPPWLGTNLCLRMEQSFFAAIQAMTRDSYQGHLQQLAWSNLPILNEWKKLYPDQNPVKVHETFWGTKLLCPGGGAYVWNEKFQTMESTVFGHPGAPKTSSTKAMADVTRGQLGVSFENQGLSARAILSRTPKH